MKTRGPFSWDGGPIGHSVATAGATAIAAAPASTVRRVIWLRTVAISNGIVLSRADLAKACRIVLSCWNNTGASRASKLRSSIGRTFHRRARCYRGRIRVRHWSPREDGSPPAGCRTAGRCRRQQKNIIQAQARLQAHVRGARPLGLGPQRQARRGRRLRVRGNFRPLSPWLEEQGHAPLAWSVLGALANATRRIGPMTAAAGRRRCAISRRSIALSAPATITSSWCRSDPNRTSSSISSSVI